MTSKQTIKHGHVTRSPDETANANFHVPSVYAHSEATINELDCVMTVMEFAKGVSVSNIEVIIRGSSSMSREERQSKECVFEDRSLELSVFCAL